MAVGRLFLFAVSSQAALNVSSGVAQRGDAPTKRVGASGAGPGRTPFGPTKCAKILAKKTRIYGIALQS
jgi:hypothetical protein